ncbi:MAG: MbcA/ParS/Xre antitoxin family protein [Gammaproteobacteria bacterium]|nr:MbcA/ParS/Xre antitoxin family protein [Gammaproteobacteria bacterium]
MSSNEIMKEIPEDLLDLAIDMMQGDRESAIRWLSTPLEILRNESPLTYIEQSSSNGALDIKNLIGRIRHGVYS